MSELRIVQTRLHATGVLLSTVALCAAGIWMIEKGEPFGWLAAIMFGLGALVLSVTIWRPHAIVFTHDLLTIETAFSSHRYPWRDITRLRIWEYRRLGMTTNRFVTFDVREPKATESALAGMARSGHASLPPIGRDADELLAIANKYWRHANNRTSRADQHEA